MVYRDREGRQLRLERQGRRPPVPARAQEGADADPEAVVEHTHSEFRSLTGGFVYHGKRLPDSKGAYIYGDFDTGRVWMLRYDAKRRRSPSTANWPTRRSASSPGARMHDGELYALDLHRRRHPPPRAGRRRRRAPPISRAS